MSTSEPFRSVVVPLDLSAASARVIDRTALLPFAPGAELMLLHVVPSRLDREASASAQADARKALGLVAKGLRKALPKVKVEPVVIEGDAAAEIAAHAKIAEAELVVMGRAPAGR